MDSHHDKRPETAKTTMNKNILEEGKASLVLIIEMLESKMERQETALINTSEGPT